MKGTRFINRFSEKILIWANGQWYAPKIAHPHNSGSAGGVFLKFCTVKGTNSYMKMILIIFPKKLFGANGSFLVQKWCILTTLD